jgi:peptide/nickel transport system ATP-binding protein
MREPALTIAGLRVRDRDARSLVGDVSLSVPRGGVLTLIGETGSGKSLIAQAVFGLLPPGLSATGTIAIGDMPPIAASDHRSLAALWRENIMLIPQEPSLALDPTMRIGSQMTLSGIASRDVPPALRAFDLPDGTERAYPFALSGGMAQRVLVAAALGVNAPLVVADEPTKGLDPDRVTQAIATLRRLAAAGRSLFVITHDRRVAEELRGDIAILRDGEIVERGDTRTILAGPRSDYGRTWLAADPRHWPRRPACCDMSRLLLSAHGLAFGWPGRPLLLRGLDLHVPAGGVLAISGPSGSGKSTLADILLGLRRPLAGSVEWAGIDIVADPAAIRPRRRRYQKLHQDPILAFLPQRSLEAQFRTLEEVNPDLSVARDLPPLLERLKIRPGLLSRRPSEISGGEAQRLALARILLLDPAVIVADEPTSRLDPVVQRETMSLLREIIEQRGLGLILISHDRDLAHAIADEHLALATAP